MDDDEYSISEFPMREVGADEMRDLQKLDEEEERLRIAQITEQQQIERRQQEELYQE